ncbi:hypothetical protein Y032_0073g744 [Ancylostoma ceylanicum]|nr:hypothetical protein Y032_0073g744 [Ancylostoma ceylanicum]
MDRIFEMMNQQSEHIKLTRETPTQDWLPFTHSRYFVDSLIGENAANTETNNHYLILHRFFRDITKCNIAAIEGSSDGLILFVFLRLVEGTKRRLDQTMLVGRLQFTLLRRASEATPTQLTYYSTNRRDDSSYPTKFCRKERNPQSPVV